MKPDHQEFEHDLTRVSVLRKRRSEPREALGTEVPPRFQSRWAHATSTSDRMEYAGGASDRLASCSAEMRSSSMKYQRRKTDRAQMGTLNWTTDAASGVWGRLRRVVMSVVGLPC